ncbi:MAG: lysylphosphatidylglycerol synthase transmembrane domain-containing protein [Candidatus Zhuqueibacterota bacterium]
MKKSINSQPSNFDLSKLVKKFIFIIPLGIFINLGLTIFTKDKTALVSVINFSFHYFLLAILLIIIPWFTNVFRLKLWAHFFKRKLSFFQSLKIIFYSELSAAISPSAIGGAPLKIGLLMQKRVSSGAAFTITSIGTIEDIAFLGVALPLAIIWTAAWKFPTFSKAYHKLQGAMVWVGIIVVSLVIVLFLLYFIMKKIKPAWFSRHTPEGELSFFSRVRRGVFKFGHDLKAAYSVIIRRGKFTFFITTILTGIQWICRYSVISALVASLGMPVQPILFFVLQWMVNTIAIFIPTPGATGGAEASFYLIFLAFLPPRTIGMVTAGWRFITFYSYLAVGGILYLITRFIVKFRSKGAMRKVSLRRSRAQYIAKEAA